MFFQKPENALKRAEELILVNQKSAALESLEALFKSRKHRQWQQSLEPVMCKLLQLCVETRQGKRAKEGLIQFRSVAQGQPQSLEIVVRSFLTTTAQAVQVAQAKLDERALEEIEDLEALQTPEGLLLSALRGEQGDDRAGKEDATQWVRFQWEVYRSVLEVLKNNAKLEELYTEAAKGAFAFCLKYRRHTEFRRLCELLRSHLAHLSKTPHSQYSSSLSSPETLQFHLDARFAQLKTACDLELWQEAFRSAEDLHGLMMMNKKPPRAQQLQVFYTRLAQIFWVSGNYLFHAYAIYKLYALSRTPKINMPQEALEDLASQLLLAALSVPPASGKNSHAFEMDVMQKEKKLRMAALLGYSKAPKREQLLPELLGKGISGIVLPELRGLYDVLESDFQPLDLTEKMRPLLAFVQGRENLAKYVKPLQFTVLLRLLQQLSQVYQTLTIESFAKLADFVSFHDCEKFIVESVSAGHVQVRIDHKNATLNFGSVELESDQMRKQLAFLASRLQSAVKMITASGISPSAITPASAAAGGKKGKGKEVAAHSDATNKASAFANARQLSAEEHAATLSRRDMIEKRKEAAEQAAHQRAEEEKARAEQERRIVEENERLRVAAETARRAEEEARREREARELEEKKLILEHVSKLQAKRTGTEKKIDEQELEKIKDMDRKQLIDQKKQEIAKEKEDFAKKMSNISQRMDFMERARRELEQPLLVADYQKSKEDARVAFESEMRITIETARSTHEHDVAEKRRVVRMIPDRDALLAAIRVKREAEYTVILAEHEKKVEALKEDRRLRREQKKKEEEERRQREEEERRQQEDRDAANAAEKQRKQEEDAKRSAEQRKKLFGDIDPEEANARARRREAEIEAKLEADRRGDRPAPVASAPSGWRAREAEREAAGGSSSGGGWRRQEEPGRSDRDRDSRPSGGFGYSRDGDRDRDRDSRPSGGFGYSRDGDRDRDRDSRPSGGFGYSRDGDRDRDRDSRPSGGFGYSRDGDRDRDRDRDSRPSGGFGYSRDGDRDRDSRPSGGFGYSRDGDRDRDRDSRPSGGFGYSRDGDRDRPRFGAGRDDGGERKWGNRSEGPARDDPPPRSGGEDDGFTTVRKARR